MLVSLYCFNWSSADLSWDSSSWILLLAVLSLSSSSLSLFPDEVDEATAWDELDLNWSIVLDNSEFSRLNESIVLLASTSTNSVWICFFSLSISLVLRSSTSASLSLMKLRSLLKSFPDPSKSPRILVGSPMWTVKVVFTRFPKVSTYLAIDEFPVTYPEPWSSDNPLYKSWTVLETAWNWVSFSLRAAPLSSAKALAFSIYSLAYLIADAIANLSPSIVWSIS